MKEKLKLVAKERGIQALAVLIPVIVAALTDAGKILIEKEAS